MSDFHNYVASDLQVSLDRMREERDNAVAEHAKAELGRQYMIAKCADTEDELERYKNMCDRLAAIVYAAGCYTYPTYLDYKKLTKKD